MGIQLSLHHGTIDWGKGLTMKLNSMVLTIQVLAYVKVEDQRSVVINDIDLVPAGSHDLLTEPVY